MDAGYDRIILQNLRVDCLVGVDAWERPKHQPLIISVIVASDVKGSVSSVGDGLSSQHTVSYGDIQTRIREFAAVHSYRTLEALAMAIAHHCFTQCGVRSLNNEGGVSVYIEKPKALLHAQSVGIEITRTRQELEELDALLTAKDNGPSQSLASKIPKSPLPLEPYDLQIGADKIIIRQLACSTIIGINPWERVQKQRLFIDITVHLHLVSSFILVDKIPNVFNFRTMVKAIAEYVESTSFKTLEMLIENIAGILGREFHAPKVWVRISKPSAVIYADTAAVEITRTRDSAGPIRKKVRLDGDGVSDADLHTVFIGIGSNLGNRAKNISFGIQELCKDSSVNRLLDTSFLYETKPMYVTEQPNFLNAAFKIETKLTPSALLTHIKDIEAAAGRNFGEIRNGPRPLDMDILFYDSLELKTPTLEIPHKLIHEREFVLRPLCDIAPTFPHPTRFRTCSHLLGILLNTEGYDTSMPMLQVTPFHTRLTSSKDSPVWTWSTRTRVMGILNVTPDSFSDGGEFTDLERAVAAAKAMISAGAHVIDIGGQSTRPGADMVTEEVECARVVPVVEALRREIGEGVLISVDTFRAAVAKKAILAGADFINDVTGAAFDPNMVTVMAELNVPVCIMHMRGDPKTMQSLTTYENNDVTSEVRTVLTAHVSKLIHAGVYRWNIILDPGIGFAKTGDQNFKLLRELHAITAKGALARFPLLVGPSRKGFLKAGLDEKRQADPKERVWATAAACCAAVMGGAGILRVHDVKEMVDVIATSDILYRR